MSVQIVEQWMERDDEFIANAVTKHLCRVKNLGAKSGAYYPQALMAPAPE